MNTTSFLYILKNKDREEGINRGEDMPEDAILRITLSIIIATLAAIVYSLRYIVLIDRKIERIEQHIDKLIHKVVEKQKRR